MSKDKQPKQTDPGAKAAEEKADAVFKHPPADDTTARAKSSRHGKVTADKWNQ